jgi:hypothetical protein
MKVKDKIASAVYNKHITLFSVPNMKPIGTLLKVKSAKQLRACTLLFFCLLVVRFTTQL